MFHSKASENHKWKTCGGGGGGGALEDANLGHNNYNKEIKHASACYVEI